MEGRPLLVVLFLALILVIWAQKRALLAFFSSPDDMVHLQQAAGLKPLVASPFRFISQVVYFHVMVGVFGPMPIAFHVTSLVVHLLNVALAFSLFLRLGAPRMVAGLSASLFGSFPLFFPLLASAVGMNDELALTFTLLSLILVRSRRPWSSLGAAAAFLVALLCKESVLAFPLLAALVAGPAYRVRRIVPLCAISGIFSVLLLLRPPQGLEPYAVALGMNVFHNAMTYASWAVNVARPMPDMVSSFDPGAWRVGACVYAGIIISWLVLRASRSLIRIGAAWWLAGLLPVLVLRLQTFRHYLYPALPGIALVAGVSIFELLNIASSTIAPANGNERRARIRSALLMAMTALCAMAYSVHADALIRQRLLARVKGTRLALDPFIRRQEVASYALGSLARSLPREGPVSVAILEPEGTERVFGARTGREYASRAHRQPTYDLLKESLDGGGAVKLFFPQVGNIDFIHAWGSQYAGHELFVPYLEGALIGFGKSRSGVLRAADWMVDQGMMPQARALLDSLGVAYPGDPAVVLRRQRLEITGGAPLGCRRNSRRIDVGTRVAPPEPTR